MARHLHLDPSAGISGAQVIALLLNLTASREKLVGAVEDVAPGTGVEIAEGLVDEVRTLTARLDRDDGERSALEVRRAIEDAALPGRARTTALASLAALVEATARVTGPDSEEVVLAGGWGIAATLAGCSVLLDDLEVTSVSCGPLVLGGPDPSTSREHGTELIVADLLDAYEVYREEGGTSEPVTPVGAALIAALAEPSLLHPGMRIEREGHGAGAEDGQGVPHLLRGWLGQRTGTMVELSAIVTGEESEQVSYALNRLQETGALECWSESVALPEGRHGIRLAAVGDLRQESELRAVLHRETAALSVQATLLESVEARHTTQVVSTAFGEVPVLRKADWLHPDLDRCATLARERQVPLHRVLEAAKHAARRADPRAGGRTPEGRGQGR